MDTFSPYLEKIDDPKHRERLSQVLQWVRDTFPELDPRIAWNQPMFTHQGTFIIGFSRAKAHLAVSPEYITLQQFSDELEQAGYHHTTMLFRIPWQREVDYELLRKMIEFNIKDKASYTTFWRKYE
ncbi:MAG TPA: iron chaperone [Tissierellia bacterium]|nr:iron chaperone [Tissierellia bacterium]